MRCNVKKNYQLVKKTVHTIHFCNKQIGEPDSSKDTGGSKQKGFRFYDVFEGIDYHLTRNG